LMSSGLVFGLDGIIDDGEGERTTEGICGCSCFRLEMVSGAVMTFGSQV